MTNQLLALPELTGIDWLFLFSELAITVLGLSISYIAYVGYRRSDSRPMLYFCIGFILVVGVPAIVGVVVVFGGVAGEQIAGLISQTSTIIGMVLILVALRISG
jgi:hypothetical protein